MKIKRIILISAILLILFNFITTCYIPNKTISRITGSYVGVGSGEGSAVLCVNYQPVMDEIGGHDLISNNQFSLDVNATDVDGHTISFYSNDSSFSINENTGVMDITAPSVSDYQDIFVKIWASDGIGCENSNDTEIVLFNITSVLQLSITNFYPQNNVTISEEGSQTFNVTLQYSGGTTLKTIWYLNNSLIASSSQNYTFVANYTSAGVYNVSVFINYTSGGTYISRSRWWTMNVTNVDRPPYFNKTIENQTWNEDTVLTAFDLDDYIVKRQENRALNYSYKFTETPHNIIISINSSTHLVTFSQPNDWYGTEYVVFNVSDGYSSNVSNNITLTVVNVAEPVSTTPPTRGGEEEVVEACIEDWSCSQWTSCSPEGSMHRECTDINGCGSEKRKPKEEEGCTYTTGYYNSIMDHEEEGVDCGGVGSPCIVATCFDEIQNQGEEGIDCGGPCVACSVEKPSPSMIEEAKASNQSLKNIVISLLITARSLFICLVTFFQHFL